MKCNKVPFIPLRRLVLLNPPVKLPESGEVEYLPKSLSAFSEGDILLAKVTPCFENGNLCIAKELTNNVGVGSTELFVLRIVSSLILPDYLLFLFQQDRFKSAAVSEMRGTGGLKRIPPEWLLSYKFPVPSLEVQKEIVNRLNTKLSIASVLSQKLSDKRELLEAVQESLVTRLVTKGLDLNVPMKDSGIPWIGEIPAHWRVTSIGMVCDNIRDGTHFSPKVQSDGYAYITAEDIHGEGLDLDKAKKISEEDFLRLVRENCKPAKGDVLLVKDGATTGRSGLMINDLDCVTLSSVAMLTPKKELIRSRYLRYMLDSSLLQYQIKMTMFGSAMPRTTLTRLSRYLVLLPPLDEQQAIETFCYQKIDLINKASQRIQEQIDKLQEYRSSFISAAFHEELA